MLEKNPDTLKVVYKAFPLRSHKLAGPAVEGALAAHAQGRFWEFHDKVFSYIYPKPGPKKLEVLSKFQLFEDRSWTIPTLVGNRLFVRNNESIVALELG